MEKEKQLTTFIEKELQLEDKSVTLKTNLVDDLHLDSLDRFQMISELESEFNVTFPEEGLEQIETVGDILNVLNSVA